MNGDTTERLSQESQCPDAKEHGLLARISLDETRKLIDSYYQSKTVRTPKDEDEEEADKVSAD